MKMNYITYPDDQADCVHHDDGLGVETSQVGKNLFQQEVDGPLGTVRITAERSDESQANLLVIRLLHR